MLEQLVGLSSLVRGMLSRHRRADSPPYVIRVVRGQEQRGLCDVPAVPMRPIGQAPSRAFTISSAVAYWPEIC